MKVWKFALSWAPFVNRIESFSQKCTEELSLMTMKSDPNFKEKRTFSLKNDMRNLVNFREFENLHFDGLLLSKVCNV